MANALVAGGGNKGHEEGTTQAAVADGTITIRNKDNQQQDVADLSRDTEHANDSISPIFDKEKEQNRLKEIGLISDIGGQAADVSRTQGDLMGRDAQKDPAALAEARQQLAAEGKPVTDVAVSERAYNNASSLYGTGGEVQRGIQAVTGALTALASGGNLAGTLAGASAPELAHLLKPTEGNAAVNTIAHAILGGAVAAIQGNNAAAGAAGAVSGELVARAIKDQLFPDKDNRDLSESDKQLISNLATIASGLAGNLTGGDSSSTTAGAQAGKNAVENNYLSEKESRQLDKEMQDCKVIGGDCSKVVEKYIDISNKNSKELVDACTGGGVACVTWEELIKANTNVALDANKHQIRLSDKLKDPDAAAIVKYLNGTDLKFLKDNITTGDRVMDVIMTPTSWPVAVMGAKAIITNSAGFKEQLIAAGVSSAANTAIQYGTSKTGEVKLSDVIGAGVIGLITAGKGYNPTVNWNAAGGYYQTEINGDDPFMGALLSKAGASVGYAAGNIIKIPMDKKINPISKQYEWVPTGVWTITKPAPQNNLPSLSGNVADSAASGWFSEALQNSIQNKGNSNVDK